MKGRKNLLEQLKSLPHFGKNIVYQLGLQLGLKDGTVDTYISRFLKYKEIIWLNKGLYVSTDFFEKNKNDISYSFYLANVIRTPSYVSSWAALQYYNLATEVVHSITSVSLKATRDFETKAGNFSYQSIKKDLFSDFSLTKGKFDFYIASPSKALFDLLYFRTRQFRSVKPAFAPAPPRLRRASKAAAGRPENIKALIEELRIDIAEMDKLEQEKFYYLVKREKIKSSKAGFSFPSERR